MSLEEMPIRTLDHVEEDLALNYDEEKIISSEKKSECFKNAATDVLSKYGKFIDNAILQTVFPNIDINAIEEYDFKNFRLKLFVLDNHTFDELLATKTSDNKPDKVVGRFTLGQDYIPEHKSHFLHKSQIAGLIYVKQSHYEKGYLEDTIRHEMLHALGIGDGLTRYLEEGVVTYLEIMSGHKKEIPKESGSTEVNTKKERELRLSGVIAMAKDFLNESYTSRAVIFRVLHVVTTDNEGWTNNQYYESLINRNSPQRKELLKCMVKNADRGLFSYFKELSEFYKE